MREGVRDTVGRLLRTLRERRGLSLVRVEQLAESCGNRISRSRLSQHEIPEISRQAAALLAGIEQETGRTANAGRGRKRARDFMAAPALTETEHLPAPLAGRNGVTPGRTMS